MMSTSLRAQVDMEWWAQKHNWDGVTPWRNYLTISPAHLGPNALPVPFQDNGLIGQEAYFQVLPEVHVNPGDFTQDIFLRLHVPFAEGRIALQLFGVPVEHYSVDTATRDSRKGRNRATEGWEPGDLYASTLIQIVKDRKFPDVTLGISFKTAAGSLNSARFTDAPAYYFHLGFGKNLLTKSAVQIRPSVMTGFYVWQVYHEHFFQNDAFLFGAGLEAKWRSFILKESLRGYIGYIDDGDKPVVNRMELEYRSQNVGVEVYHQIGLQDFPFFSLGAGFKIYW